MIFKNGDCSLKGFLSIVGDSSNEREIRKLEEGQNRKVKLLLYNTFNKVVEALFTHHSRLKNN